MKSKEIMLWCVAAMMVVGSCVYAVNRDQNSDFDFQSEPVQEKVAQLDQLYEDADLEYIGSLDDLSEDELSDIAKIYERYEEIYDDLSKDGSNLSDYKEELENLADQMLECEVASGVYGDLSKEEVKEMEDLYHQQSTLYEKGEESGDLDAYLEENEEEVKEIENKLIKLQVKAGNYGNLTEKEALELEDLYEKAGMASESQLEKIQNKILTLEVKAGYYGQLTEAEAKKLETLYQKQGKIYDKALESEDFDAYIESKEDTLETIENEIEELEQKAGFYEDVA